ncbi:MAG: ketopantoate reductase family protein [Peptococcales bacterium]
MKYLVIGAGGTGGSIGGFLALKGKDVSFIARGNHLKALREKGLVLHSGRIGKVKIKKIKAYTADEFTEKVNVIFLCIKAYSVEEIIPLIKKASNDTTIVIPVLNAFAIGDALEQLMPNITFLDGCVYVNSYISNPGEIVQLNPLFTLVFGARESQPVHYKLLEAIKNDIADSGIDVILSNNIKRDTFRKFSFTSAYASAGAFHNVPAKDFQKEGVFRNTFISLVKEIKALANAMNIYFESDLLIDHLKIIDGFTPDTTASLQKDLAANKNNEIDQIIFNIVRLGKKYKVEMPTYLQIAQHFGYKEGR